MSGRRSSWAKVLEANRHAVLSASMMAIRGRIQREEDVVHLIAQRVTNLSADLAIVDSLNASFPLPHGRGDGVRNGGSSRDPLSSSGSANARHFTSSTSTSIPLR